MSGNASCDLMVPVEWSTPSESFRKELFGEPPSIRLCTIVSSQEYLLLCVLGLVLLSIYFTILFI